MHRCWGETVVHSFSYLTHVPFHHHLNNLTMIKLLGETESDLEAKRIYGVAHMKKSDVLVQSQKRTFIFLFFRHSGVCTPAK